jgi:hypothetical protein
MEFAERMDYEPSGKLTANAFELNTELARLGLSHYEERLQENGFQDWETVTAITETDMDEMDFKRGDRRKLQHAIREYRSASASHTVYEIRDVPMPSEGLPTRTIRSYRRHPRPDPNAPHKPRTAYVLFSEHVRQDPGLSHSSFTEIAKETGKRWRELPSEERIVIWETPAADRLQDYKKKLERYKQTKNYHGYQAYLEEFEHQRHNPESTLLSENTLSSTHEPAISGQLPASQEGLEATRQESAWAPILDLEGGSQETASHIKEEMEEDMEEVRHILKASGINTHLTRVAAFPPEDITDKAVEAFVHGTGSLLHLWNRDEAFNLVRSVYHPQSDSKPVCATEVFAMSAVGSYCDADSHTMLAREKFLHFFLYMLSSSSDVCLLRRMRLFACLAICRFTNSVESARRLMCKELMLFEFRNYQLTTRSISP